LYFKFTQKALGTVTKFQFLLSDLFWTLGINLKHAAVVYFRITEGWRRPLRGILFNPHHQSRAKSDKVTWDLVQTCFDGYFATSQPLLQCVTTFKVKNFFQYLIGISLGATCVHFASHPFTVCVQEKS